MPHFGMGLRTLSLCRHMGLGETTGFGFDVRLSAGHGAVSSESLPPLNKSSWFGSVDRFLGRRIDDFLDRFFMGHTPRASASFEHDLKNAIESVPSW